MKKLLAILAPLLAGATLVSSCFLNQQEENPDNCYFVRLNNLDGTLWETVSIPPKLELDDPEGTYQIQYSILYKENDVFLADTDESHFTATSSNESVATVQTWQHPPIGTVIVLDAGPVGDTFKSGETVITFRYSNGDDTGLCNFKVIRK